MTITLKYLLKLESARFYNNAPITFSYLTACRMKGLTRSEAEIRFVPSMMTATTFGNRWSRAGQLLGLIGRLESLNESSIELIEQIDDRRIEVFGNDINDITNENKNHYLRFLNDTNKNKY